MLGLFDGPIFAVAVLLLLSKFGRPPLLRDFDLIIFLIFFFTRDLRRLEARAGMRCEEGPEPRPEVLLWNLRSLDNVLFSPPLSPGSGLSNSRLLISPCPSLAPLIGGQPLLSIIITSDHPEPLMVAHWLARVTRLRWCHLDTRTVTWDSSDPDHVSWGSPMSPWHHLDHLIRHILVVWVGSRSQERVTQVCLTYFMLDSSFIVEC